MLYAGVGGGGGGGGGISSSIGTVCKIIKVQLVVRFLKSLKKCLIYVNLTSFVSYFLRS